jgi:hypothetical protein
MLNVSTCCNTADIYAIANLIPHVCQHIRVDHICYYCLLVANQGNYVCGLFLFTKKVSLSIGIRITMIHHSFS